MDSDQLARAVFERTRTPAFRDYLRDLLVDICAVDTTPNSDVTVMRRAEAKLMRRKELYRRAEAAEKCAATLHGPCRPLRRQSAY